MNTQAPVQTSPVAPPSIALARMAWNLAWQRQFGHPTAVGDPMDRGDEPDVYPASAVYYAIIDRISRGEQP